MASIAKKRGYAPHLLLTEEATASAVKDGILAAARQLQAGDFFFLTFAGHGSQIPDMDHDEEPDGLDETWLLYDRQMPDDEINGLLDEFRPGVRIFTVSDSCHSGSIARDTTAPTDGFAIRTPPNAARLAIIAAQSEQCQQVQLEARHRRASGSGSGPTDLLQLSACQDNEVAYDGVQNGLFTEKFKLAFADNSDQDYLKFSADIRRRLAPRQRPNLVTEGDHASYFAAEPVLRLASTTPVNPSSPAFEANPKGTNAMPTLTNSHDNWVDVAYEFEKRLGAAALTSVPTRSLTSYDSDLGQPFEASDRGERGGPVVARAFWWGFHVEIPHEQLNILLDGGDVVNNLVGMIGGSIPSPAAPFIRLIALFVAGIHAGLRALDRGRGVYISMLWIAPGIFVPTSVV